MFLSGAELRDLTGYQKPSAQKRWLEAQAISFMVGGDGLPKVLRAVVIARLGGSFTASPEQVEPKLRFPSADS